MNPLGALFHNFELERLTNKNTNEENIPPEQL